MFGHKSKPQVDMDDLEEEKDLLITFLESNLKIGLARNINKLTFASDAIPPQELQRLVTKFIYKRHLNTTYYASLNGSTVRVNKFEKAKKQEKRSKYPTPPKMAHGF